MKSDFSEKTTINIAKWMVALSTVFIIFSVVLIFIYLNYCPFDKPKDFNVSQTGQFGDTFNGILAPIIAFCAAILTFLAFYIQYEANKIQRNGLAVQQFDNTFFNLISNHQQVVNNIDEDWVFDTVEGRVVEKPVKGRAIFKKIACSIKEIFEATEAEYRTTRYAMNITPGVKDEMKKNNPIAYLTNEFSPMDHNLDKLNQIFSIFYSTYRSAFSHYFRNLYHIVKFIDEYEGFNGLYSQKKIDEIKMRYH